MSIFDKLVLEKIVVGKKLSKIMGLLYSKCPHRSYEVKKVQSYKNCQNLTIWPFWGVLEVDFVWDLGIYEAKKM